MIVVPALHPAHDLIVSLDTLRVGAVHRAAPGAIATGVGGKSVNVALAVARMRIPVRLVILADDTLLEALDAIAAGLPDLELVAVPSPVPSRADLAIVSGDGLTVINTTAADPGAGAVAHVHAATLQGLSGTDVLVLAGSTPAGTEDAHPALATHSASKGIHTIVDADGPALAALLATGPTAVKVAAAEAASLGDRSPGPAGRKSGSAVGSARARPSGFESAPIVGITDGVAGLRAWLPDGRAVLVRPPVDLGVTSPLGAGDAVTAGLAIALDRGDDPLDGFILGTAMAASTLDHLDPSVRPDLVDRYRTAVSVIDLV
jgi:fructose-1-phosphate kinase PfkB-like protein